MRYRAILNDPGNASAERPSQILSNNREDVDSWAQKVLQSAVSENAWVDVYQNVEQRIAVVRKPAKAIQGTQL